MQSHNEDFIPALRVNWATKFYDPLVRICTREQTFKSELISQANIKNNQKILDLACGTGTLSIKIKKRFPNVDIFAVDADEKILNAAIKKSQKNDVEIKFQQSFSDKLPFQNEKFDHVFSTLFFHHLTLTKKIKTLVEISRVLKSTGEFHIADYGKPSNNFQKMLSNIIRFIDGEESTRNNIAGHLSSLFKENGFSSVERVKSYNTILGTIRLFNCKK